ncbi:MAG: hypothetical protein OEY67_05495 [Gammaproteobacteria bacterium]|nr:hypothetical protein [Gammaproteobacteria bacterium]
MRIRSFNIVNGLKWFNCGWRFFKNQPKLWLTISSVFVVFSYLILLIPVAGMLIFAFFMPVVVCSTITIVQQKPVPAQSSSDKKNMGQALQQFLVLAGKGMFSVLGHMDNLAAVMTFGSIGFLTAILVNIVEKLIAGPGLLDNVSVLDLGFVSMMQFLFVRTLSILIYIVVAAFLSYAIALVMVGKRPIVPAVKYSSRALLKNHQALIAFFAVMALPLVVALIASAFISPLISGLVIIVLGTLAFPVAICSVYCSAKLMFQ